MKKGTSLALGAIIGAAVGVAAGILTAPKSGKETRADIKNKTGELKNQAAKSKDELVLKAEEIGDGVRAKVIETIESVTSHKEKK